MTAPRSLYADPPMDPNAAESSAPKGGPSTDGYPRDLDDAHARLVRWFEESENTGTDARDRSNRDRDYVTGIQWTQAELKAQFESVIPRREMGRPEEIASVALFLASDDSSYVNGMELVVDGGTTTI
jgi:NAD(P)-dependent dehydrogenase (short-subunit alcohol dehydrogenase family)